MATQAGNRQVDESPLSVEAFVHLSRLALGGSLDDVTTYVRRQARRLQKSEPDAAAQLLSALKDLPTRSSPLRRQQGDSQPIDRESRTPLTLVETNAPLRVPPLLSPGLEADLEQVVRERTEPGRLVAAGLEPTRSLLFVGPPGVGKTMAARWLADRLETKLIVLDLSAVMSSLLGRTGTNLRRVLDYAKEEPCVLLLDEFDAIAKRRDDDSDVGELKRLVTVLLQQIDDWPSSAGLLVAATNHAELLDPAVWRRFDSVLEFPLPDVEARRAAIERFANDALPTELHLALALASEGRSFNDLERDLLRVRRAAAVSGQDPADIALVAFRHQFESSPPDVKRNLAVALVQSGAVSQRMASNLTGISRDTIRKDMVISDGR